VVQASDAGTTAQKVDFVGKWSFAGMTCDGKALIFSGYQETVEWTDTTFHSETASSKCKVMFDNPIKVVDGQPVKADNPKVTCAPEACSLDYSVTLGAEKQSFTKKCPDDFLVTAADPKIVFGDGSLSLTIKNGDVTCVAKYTKF
jgi:hypothetical protein